MKRLLSEIRKSYPNARLVLSKDPIVEDNYIELTDELGLQLFGGLYVPFVDEGNKLWMGNGSQFPMVAIKELEDYLQR